MVTASRSYYSKLGFVWCSDNAAQYREQLKDAIMGRYDVTAELRDNAMYCYYLTQCCNWVLTPFSPEGYDDWGRARLSDLFRDDAVQAMLTSAQSDTPIAVLMHETKMRERAASQ